VRAFRTPSQMPSPGSSNSRIPAHPPASWISRPQGEDLQRIFPDVFVTFSPSFGGYLFQLAGTLLLGSVVLFEGVIGVSRLATYFIECKTEPHMNLEITMVHPCLTISHRLRVVLLGVDGHTCCRRVSRHSYERAEELFYIDTVIFWCFLLFRCACFLCAVRGNMSSQHEHGHGEKCLTGEQTIQLSGFHADCTARCIRLCPLIQKRQNIVDGVIIVLGITIFLPASRFRRLQ